jgi:DNA-binding NarL/FixJ family response regulator
MLFRPIRLAIVEAHVLFRKTLRNYLLDQKNVDFVIQASNLAELLDKLRSATIDILIMDSMVEGVNCIDAVKTIRTEYPFIRILILSLNTEMDLINDLLESGIHGYISKSEEPEELLQAIQAVADNRIYRNRLFTEALYWNKQNSIDIKHHRGGLLITLNEREKRILNLIWDEKSNREIAEELFLGVRSIEKIRQDLKEKISVKSTIGLIKYAIDKRIIRIGTKNSEPNFIK